MFQFVPFVALITAMAMILTSTLNVLPVMALLGLFILIAAAISPDELEREPGEHHREDNWRHW